MRIEIGAFGGPLPPDGSVAELFLARVVIPTGEFARLGLGQHEQAGAIPECFRWCHAAFGLGGARWSVRLPEESDAVVLFAEEHDARAFFARWGSAKRAAGPARAIGRMAAAALMSETPSAT
jgi:hypothetical protein